MNDFLKIEKYLYYHENILVQDIFVFLGGEQIDMTSGSNSMNVIAVLEDIESCICCWKTLYLYHNLGSSIFLFAYYLSTYPVLATYPLPTQYPPSNYPVPFLYLPGTSYPIPPTEYLLLGTSYPIPPTWYLLLSTSYSVPPTRYLPGTYPVPTYIYKKTETYFAFYILRHFEHYALQQMTSCIC